MHIVDIEKPWGVTRIVTYNESGEVWHASIKAGGFSSKHYHETKINTFYVLSGRLMVEFFNPTNLQFTHQTVLNGGDILSVEPRIWHKFVAVTNVELIEVYTLPKMNLYDIVRNDSGGLDEKHK